MITFSKPILGVEEYEGAYASALLRFTLASGRFNGDSLLDSFIPMNISSFLLSNSICLSICLFFNFLIFHLCGAHEAQFVARVRIF
jgi:hypothetical protein